MSDSQMLAFRMRVLSLPAAASSRSILARICRVCSVTDGTRSSATIPARYATPRYTTAWLIRGPTSKRSIVIGMRLLRLDARRDDQAIADAEHQARDLAA